MKRSIIVGLNAIWLLVGAASAQEGHNVIIYKEPGLPPRVDAAGVDLLGAEKIHQMLGEDFFVFHDEGAVQGGGVVAAATAEPLVKPVEPAVPPGTLPPVLPICQCPEDYVAALQARIETFDQQEFFTPRRLSVTTDQFEALKSGAFPQIDILRQNDMLMMDGQ